jgi:DNA-binding MarR family transcriptional regulator
MKARNPGRPSKTTRSTLKSAANTSALDGSVGYSLRRAQLSVYSDFARVMDKFEIRPSQFALLVIIRCNPGLTQSVVAGLLSIQKANLVSLLDSLDARGLIERRKVAGDGRASALFLTPNGATFTRKIEAAHATLETKLRSRLGEKSSDRLLDLLQRFWKQS